MNILQAALRVIGWRDAQKILDRTVPGARQIGDRQIARHHRALQPKAHDDMRRIGHFVGIDANQRAFDVAPKTAEILHLVRFRIATETGVQRPAQPVEVGVVAAGLHFNDQRLALMDAHSGRFSNRLAHERGRQAAFIHRVAGFVDHRHDRLTEICRVVTRGDAHIRWDSAGKRVGRPVQPRMIEIEADSFRDTAA